MVEDTHSEQRTSREISNANLKPFKLGESGNPGGRKKDLGITAGQIKRLDTPCKFDPTMTWREWLEEQGLIMSGTKPVAHEKLKDRIEGPVKEELEVTEIPPVKMVPTNEYIKELEEKIRELEEEKDD